MTTPPSTPQSSKKPSRSDRLKPLELVGGSGLFALFTGIIVLVTAREPIFALITTGVVFIVALVCLALLSMAYKPDAAEVLDLDEQNRDGDAKH